MYPALFIRKKRGRGDMSERFEVARKREVKLARKIMKKYKRYKIGTAILWAWAILSLVIWFGWWFWMCKIHNSDIWEDIDLPIQIWLALIGPIPMMLIHGVRIGGGRDIFLARMNQQIVFLDEYFSNIWTPRFPQIEPAKVVEYRIAYADVERIVYNAEWERLEIYGKRDVYKLLDGEMQHSREEDEKPFLIYTYFEGMDRLAELLSRQTGLEINKIGEGAMWKN